MTAALVVVDSSGVHVGVLGFYRDAAELDRQLVDAGWRPPLRTSGPALGPGGDYYTRPGCVRLAIADIEAQSPKEFEP